MHHGACPVHGPLACLDESGDPDEDSLAYTKTPVPHQLTVKPSSIPAAGLGVFAKSFVPRGVKMGPYIGEKIDKEDVTEDTITGYMWEASILFIHSFKVHIYIYNVLSSMEHLEPPRPLF